MITCIYMITDFEKSNNDANFSIYTDISHLPLNENPSYLVEGFVGVCTGGHAVVEIFSHSRKIIKNDLVVIFPLVWASIREVSDEFEMISLK